MLVHCISFYFISPNFYNSDVKMFGTDDDLRVKYLRNK